MDNPVIRNRQIFPLLALLVILALLQVSCGGGDGPAPASPPQSTTLTLQTVNISWKANRETAVNSSGGGYRVYYSTTSGFAQTDTDVKVVDVPFVTPPTAPTSVSIDLPSGQYYFRVVAYSALTPPWGSGGSASAPSAQISLVVP